MSQNRPPSTAARKLLGRAYVVAAAVGAAIVAVTAVFVSRIADSSATAGSGTGGGTSSPTQAPGSNSAPDSQFDPGQPYYGGGGQLSVPQQNQPPVGGSHGS
jgi:hypothetical protein